MGYTLGIDTDTNIDSHIDTYSYTGSDMETETGEDYETYSNKRKSQLSVNNPTRKESIL